MLSRDGWVFKAEFSKLSFQSRSPRAVAVVDTSTRRARVAVVHSPHARARDDARARRHGDETIARGGARTAIHRRCDVASTPSPRRARVFPVRARPDRSAIRSSSSSSRGGSRARPKPSRLTLPPSSPRPPLLLSAGFLGRGVGVPSASAARGGFTTAAVALRASASSVSNEVRSIHWSPYDPVREVNADP